MNYEDPNFNISLPVFAIHGNHDDPTGENGLSAMDLLSVTNLINYFGKQDNVDDIQLRPILLSKGNTKVSLYGLGWIRDERLYRAFEQEHVKFYGPNESKDDWFRLFVVHQNRNQHHSKKANISDGMFVLPGKERFFDLVIRGHEHEQKVMPEKSTEGNFDVMQPGSSIVTSLSPEEATQKKIAVLEIYKDQYRCTPVDLQTVRPFAIRSISLQDYDELEDEKNNPEEIADFLANIIEELIEETKDRLPPAHILKKHPSLKLPLIRLKVDYSGGYASINPQRFGQRFIDKVANPTDLLILSRTRSRTTKASSSDEPKATKEEILSAIVSGKNNGDDLISGSAATDGITIDDLVAEFLKQDNGLGMINELELADAVVDFVEKEEIYAINNFIERQIKEVRHRLWKDSKHLLQDPESSGTIKEDYIEELVHKYAEQRRANTEQKSDKRRAERASRGIVEDEESEEETKSSKKRATSSKKKKQADSDDEEFEALSSVKRERTEDSEEEEEEEAPKTTRGRGRGKATTTTTRGRGRGRGRGSKATTTSRKKKVVESEEEDEESPVEDDSEEEYKPKRTTRSKASSSSAASSSKAKSTSSRKRKAQSSDEDDDVVTIDDESEEEAPPPAKRRRATTKKPVFKPL